MVVVVLKVLRLREDDMRNEAAKALIRAYLSISSLQARELLSYENDDDVREILFAMKPQLKEVNSPATDTIHLRVNRK